MRYIAEKHRAVTCAHVALRFCLSSAGSLDNLRRKTNKNTPKKKPGMEKGPHRHVVSGIAVTEQMYLFQNFPWGGGRDWRLNTEELTEGLSRRRIAVKSEQEHPQG